MGRILKYSRIIIAAIILLIVTALLVAPTHVLIEIAQWIADIQLFTLALTFSVGWFMLWIAITLMFGRIYCSTICPLGTLMDVFSSLRRRRIYRFAAPLAKLRYLMLTLAVISAIMGISWIYQYLDPYSDYEVIVATAAHLGEASAIGLVIASVLLAIVVAAALWRGRILCNTICPVGTALGTVSRYSIMHIDIDTDLCINCRRCADVCKAQCIDLNDHVVDSSRCVNCFNCLPVCPNDAIHYTTQRKQLSIPMMQSLSTGAASAMTTPCGRARSQMNANKINTCS